MRSGFLTTEGPRRSRWRWLLRASAFSLSAALIGLGVSSAAGTRGWCEPPATQETSPPQAAPPNLLDETQRTFIADIVREAREAGSPRRGLTVFAGLRTSCFSCHRIGAHGGTIGPELIGLAGVRSDEEIAASLWWPNAAVEEKYRATVALLVDGSTVRGYKVAEDDRTITLRDPATNVDMAISRDDIDETRLGSSLMPEELMTALTRRQQVDLVRLLLDTGGAASLNREEVEEVLSHAVTHTPQAFPHERAPLEPERWPSWRHFVNRDRVYDYYAKQAEYFRQHPHGPLLAAYPGLDGGKYGHWGNQDEETWRGNEWNETRLGSVHCGVFNGDGITVPRGVCVRLDAEHAVVFNPDRLCYELVWQGFVKFSDVRHGFIDGVIQAGPTIERLALETPAEKFVYHGFYRHGAQVLFAYRIGGVEYLDVPSWADGRFSRLVAPRDEHPLRALTRGGPPQWPEMLATPVVLGDDRPYAIDTIELPLENPWKAHLFGTGLGFLPDGSAIYSTMAGDIWRVAGFSPERDGASWPTRATWQRLAAGLHQPLGVHVDADGIFVMGRDQLTRLHDLNADGEADFYECYSNKHMTSAAGYDFVMGLERDARGYFYTASMRQGLVRFSPDGREARTIATGFRSPDGLGVFPDGVVTVSCSEGDWTPASMICAVRPPGDSTAPPYFGHGGPRNGEMPQWPMVYLPRGVDNSSGGQVWVTSDRWGPLQGQMIHTSHGVGSHFLLLRDEVDGRLQGAVVPLAGEFRSGAHRPRFHPRDGQLYVAGISGYGNYSPDFGCFQRVRFTGEADESAVQLPVGFHVHENGVAVRFTAPLEPRWAEDPKRHFAQCWNYRYSAAYGSPELSAQHFSAVGHDALDIASATVLDDGRTLFIELPELQRVNQLHLRLNVDDRRGHDLFCTIHALGPPRTDLPGYRAVVKQLAPHPMELDLALVTRRKPNRWSEPISGAREVELRAGRNLTFVPASFHARAGEALALTFVNPDVIPHNWALLQPGTLERVGTLANKLVADPEAFLNQYVPAVDAVICYTDIVDPQQTFTIYFRAPQAPGRYPYLCTFPGHWMVMNGVLIVE